MKFNKVFVLGGTGFLGYHTIKELLHNGIKVKTLSPLLKKIIRLKAWQTLNALSETSTK